MSWRKIVLTGFGGPDRLEIRTEKALPEPRGTELRIRVLVSSAAFTDVMIRKGLYPDVTEKPPFTPGYDLVGVVEATAFSSIGAMRRRHPDWFREDLSTLFGKLPQGRIAPVVAEVLPLDEVRRAQELIEAGAVAGKRVLRVSPPL